MTATVRIARPTRDPEAALRFYVDGVGGLRTDHFRDHAGYSGDIVRLPGRDVEIELVHGPAMTHGPTATPEDAVVLYAVDPSFLAEVGKRMVKLGFARYRTENPYWHNRASAWRDPDGYVVLLCPVGRISEGAL